MTKIKLTNGIVINAKTVEIINGVLQITTIEHTVEELAEIFSNKENVSCITLMTESEKETGYKVGFTSFAGIMFNVDGSKTIQLFQPVDVTERRVSEAEGKAAQASEKMILMEESIIRLENENVSLRTSQEIQEEAIVELANIIAE